ncbi:hypothetical protein C8Q74DRAFT_415047 [Fomes fomentarius]|nr:hypothetical protein C8Q74DRAFT_415047 [Fomes fomentarius]
MFATISLHLPLLLFLSARALSLLLPLSVKLGYGLCAWGTPIATTCFGLAIVQDDCDSFTDVNCYCLPLANVNGTTSMFVRSPPPCKCHGSPLFQHVHSAGVTDRIAIRALPKKSPL